MYPKLRNPGIHNCLTKHKDFHKPDRKEVNRRYTLSSSAKKANAKKRVDKVLGKPTRTFKKKRQTMEEGIQASFEDTKAKTDLDVTKETKEAASFTELMPSPGQMSENELKKLIEAGKVMQVRHKDGSQSLLVKDEGELKRSAVTVEAQTEQSAAPAKQDESRDINWNTSPAKDEHSVGMSMSDFAKRETERLNMPAPIPSIEEIQKEQQSPEK